MLSIDLGQKVPKCRVEIIEDGLLPCTFSLIWPRFITQFCSRSDLAPCCPSLGVPGRTSSNISLGLLKH